jgi:hypothetical protein
MWEPAVAELLSGLITPLDSKTSKPISVNAVARNAAIISLAALSARNAVLGRVVPGAANTTAMQITTATTTAK